MPSSRGDGTTSAATARQGSSTGRTPRRSTGATPATTARAEARRLTLRLLGHQRRRPSAAADDSRRGVMISWGRAFQLRQRLKGNLWVLPLVGGDVGAGFAQVIVPIDRTLNLPADWQYTSGAASSVLAAIVGAMIGLLGFVVTVSVLVVQQATGTLSPRYMRLWYRDRLQKVVLAAFVGTFTYSYSLLRRVGTDSVPNLGVTIAGLA